MAHSHEPPGMSDIVRLWMDLTVDRVLDGNRVDLEFAIFPKRSDPSKIIIVDTGGLRSKDEAALLCKIAVAKESPDEYLFASESYMLVNTSDRDRRYTEAALRGDLSLRDIPGTTDIIIFVYGNETGEYLHIVRLKNVGDEQVVTKREWIHSDRGVKQRGRFTDFRELQQTHHKGKEN